MSSLYEITQEFDALEEMLSYDEGEVSESHEQLEGYIDELLSKKTNGLIEYVRREQDRIALAKKRISELRDFTTIQQNKIERINEYVAMCMTRLGKSKIGSDMGSITLRKPTKIVQINNEEKVPSQFKTIETIVKIDKVSLKKALKESGIEGCELVDSQKKSLIYK